MQISNDCIIGVRSESEATADGAFINHSCNPNAGFKGQIFLVAMRKIRGGKK
ncbi:MAG: SET domain-containing protein-lysine N-methyltransferase [Nitrospirae bacterium]|nr:SET domain-containing protein-lysine N-methyltransferase [Nitrospirota bacterium]